MQCHQLQIISRKETPFFVQKPKTKPTVFIFPTIQGLPIFLQNLNFLGNFPEKFAPPGPCCPQQNFTIFQEKTDLSKSSLNILVLYLVILVVKREFSMCSIEDCPLYIPSYMVENPRPRTFKSQEPRQCPARDLHLRRIL